MRLLLVSGSFPPMKCGVGDYTASLANALSHDADTSVAVLTDAAATPVPADFGFEVFPVAHGWTMADAFRIRKVARSWRPDLVHVQYPTQGYGLRLLPWLLPALFRTLNVPVVQTWHEYQMVQARRNLLNAMLGGGLVTVRPNYMAMMPSWYRWLIRRKHFKFIPNASAIPKVSLSEEERSAVRGSFVVPPRRLIVYFGFAYPLKRVELLFQIADPEQDHLVLVGDLNPGDTYHRTILNLIAEEPWKGRATVAGFLAPAVVGRLLAAADAVVFPFRDGGGPWNTSVHAAVAQGTFVLTTSRERHGYDPLENVYYANPDDVPDMRNGLRAHVGDRRADAGKDPGDEWENIADAHRSLYESVLRKSEAG